jgi:hypothetical protein
MSEREKNGGFGIEVTRCFVFIGEFSPDPSRKITSCGRERSVDGA